MVLEEKGEGILLDRKGPAGDLFHLSSESCFKRSYNEARNNNSYENNI